jgi:hypothetical protein
MSSSSERAAVYRGMVEDVLAGGLLDEDEIMELRDMLARAERRALANHQAAE